MVFERFYGEAAGVERRGIDRCSEPEQVRFLSFCLDFGPSLSIEWRVLLG